MRDFVNQFLRKKLNVNLPLVEIARPPSESNPSLERTNTSGRYPKDSMSRNTPKLFTPHEDNVLALPAIQKATRTGTRILSEGHAVPATAAEGQRARVEKVKSQSLT